MTFLWLKALHIIFVICWFAGIFYLPRLFVHHALSEDAATRERLSIMEGKLFRFITPLAVLAVGFGLAMTILYWDAYRSAGWFHTKLTLVLLLIAYHVQCGRIVKQFANDSARHSHVYYRVFNELPVLVLFAVVILVVVKPF